MGLANKKPLNVSGFYWLVTQQVNYSSLVTVIDGDCGLGPVTVKV
jgi:hypothetical protein